MHYDISSSELPIRYTLLLQNIVGRGLRDHRFREIEGYRERKVSTQCVTVVNK